MTVATITREKKRRGFTSLLSQFDEPDTGNQLMSLAPDAKPPIVNLTERLNLMIAAGASFDVGTNDFQTFGLDGLGKAERDFLIANKDAVLCTLQQSLLVKYLPVDYIIRFTNEINERTAILSDGTGIQPPFEIVADVSREWFSDVVEELLKQCSKIIDAEVIEI